MSPKKPVSNAPRRASCAAPTPSQADEETGDTFCRLCFGILTDARNGQDITDDKYRKRFPAGATTLVKLYLSRQEDTRLEAAAFAGGSLLKDYPEDTGELTHWHRYTIMVGNAPITMMAGSWLPEFRACRCGDQIYIGSYFYDPDE